MTLAEVIAQLEAIPDGGYALVLGCFVERKGRRWSVQGRTRQTFHVSARGAAEKILSLMTEEGDR